MIIKMYCKLLGHDFRREEERNGTTYTSPSNNCMNCGLTKREVGIPEDKIEGGFFGKRKGEFADGLRTEDINDKKWFIDKMRKRD